jgi:hypothetical protein
VLTFTSDVLTEAIEWTGAVRARLCEKTAFLGHLYIKCIILPRQARDKHRENSKTMPFSQVYGVTKPENNRDPELFKQILAAVAVPEFVPKVRALPPVPNSPRDSTITCDLCPASLPCQR